MLDDHIARIEDAYDSIQALLDNVETPKPQATLLQQAMETLARILHVYER